MSLDKKHIELLQKLIAGTISDHEQWQLERASLDDPFLADALEGYHNKRTSKEELLALQTKINAKSPARKTKTRTLLWKRLSIAASLLILMGASMWMFQQSESLDMVSTAQKTASKQQQPKTIPAPTAAPEDFENESEKDNIIQTVEKLKEAFKKEKADIKEKKYNGDGSSKKGGIATTKKERIPDPLQKSAPPITQPKSIEGVLVEYEKSFPEEEMVMDEVIVLDSKTPAQEEDNIVKVKQEADKASPENANEKRQENGLDESIVSSQKTKAKARKIESSKVPSSPQEDLAVLSNASKIESLPIITKGVVLNSVGNPMPGVEIFDLEKNKLVETDASGNFYLPDMNGYVITAFAGYDSLTVAVSPNLSIQLQKTSETLSQPHKRLVDMMDDGELRNYYINELNVIFSKHWPICARLNNNDVSQSSGFNQRIKNNTTVHLVIGESGKIFDTTFYDELAEPCAAKISDLLFAAETAELFVAGRPMSFTYRINF